MGAHHALTEAVGVAVREERGIADEQRGLFHPAQRVATAGPARSLLTCREVAQESQPQKLHEQ